MVGANFELSTILYNYYSCIHKFLYLSVVLGLVDISIASVMPPKPLDRGLGVLEAWIEIFEAKNVFWT